MKSNKLKRFCLLTINMSMEEKESSTVEMTDDKKTKQLKQFVIVKEYNGSYNMQKKTKREYTQKTMLKERLSKSERNSLEDVLSKNEKKEKDIKYVTFMDLLPIVSDNDESSDTLNNSSLDDNSAEIDSNTIKIEESSTTNDAAEIDNYMIDSKSTQNNEITGDVIDVVDDVDDVDVVDDNMESEKNFVETKQSKTLKKIKQGAFYSLLTAGGLLAGYVLFKGVSSVDNN